MKCAKLHLQERSRPRRKIEVNLEKPRRYCQRRMVNPNHDEDPRWNTSTDRFYCNANNEANEVNEADDSVRLQQEVEDLFLTVQNLQFKGEVEHRKRPRTSFKYKTITDGKKHRMFIKQIVNCDNEEPDRLSELTCYYFDDYVKYFLNSDRSRPSSAKSSNFFNDTSSKPKEKENKATQIDAAQATELRKTRHEKAKMPLKKYVKQDLKDEIKKEPEESNMQDSKISFHKRGKRKSLTISRTESPATVQIIRVDVVCNYSSSSTMSDYDDRKQTSANELTEDVTKKKEITKLKNTRFANKYLLTNTVKTLDENVSGGAKVTLLCKTFRLADRSKLLPKKRSTRSVKSDPNNKNV